MLLRIIYIYLFDVDEDQEMEDIKGPAEQRVEDVKESVDLPVKEQFSELDTPHQKENIQSREQELQSVKDQQKPALTNPIVEEPTEVSQVSGKAKTLDASYKATTDVETVVAADSDETVISSTARVTISPPCEVTSTTLNPPAVLAALSANNAIAEDVDEEERNKSNVVETEGYLADSNNEKIIIEGMNNLT